MFFANNADGFRVYIDQAISENDYYCPACNSRMLIKRGEINSHHFAHRSSKNCDPWYTNKMSPWHKKMQNIFPQVCQEQLVWNFDRTEFHVADVLFTYNGISYIIEFQHSKISRQAFLSRSLFYLSLGYKLVWIFDFCECEKPKRIYYTYKDSRNMELVWPGNDKVRFLNSDTLCGLENDLHIFFYIRTGRGLEKLHDYEYYPPRYTWEYETPLSLERYFVKIKHFDIYSLDHLSVTYYDDDEFIKLLQKYID